MRLLIVLSCIFLYAGSSFALDIEKPLSLGEAIRIGTTNNPAIKAATAGIDAVKAQKLSSVSLPQPEIKYDRQWIPTGSSGSAETSFGISQSFDFPTVYFKKAEKFDLMVETEKQKSTNLIVDIVRQIKCAYFKVVRNIGKLKLAEDNSKLADEFLDKSKFRYDVGEGTHLEYMTAKVQSAESANTKDIVRNDLQNSYSELIYLLGFGNSNETPKYTITDSLSIDKISNRIALSPDTAISSPAIEIARSEVRVAQKEMELAEASYWPGLNISYAFQNRDDKNFSGFGIGISVPLWFMFEQKGKTNEATAKAIAAEYELNQMRNSISTGFAVAFGEYEKSYKQVLLYKNDIVPQAEEVFRTASAGYDAGENTYLEYIQAKQLLTASRNNFIDAVYNCYLSIFMLESISGQNLLMK